VLTVKVFFATLAVWTIRHNAQHLQSKLPSVNRTCVRWRMLELGDLTVRAFRSHNLHASHSCVKCEFQSAAVAWSYRLCSAF